MIDIHCHLLPNIDDGAKDTEEALQMARLASADGITDIIVTPHMQNGYYHTNPENILLRVEKLQKFINEHEISLTLHPGAEVHIHPQLIENLEDQKLLTLGHPNKYLLVEFPYVSIPDYSYTVVRELVYEKKIPVLAHPERTFFAKKDLQAIREWIELGGLIQINVGSLLGHSGKSIQRFTQVLIKNKMVHVVASDAHNSRSRKPLLSHAYQEIEKVGQWEDVDRLKENAQAILKGEVCQVHTPVTRRYWNFGSFFK
jgi:protein-tyrosine phosphatase